ncbi:ABC-2 type transport system permease protein [Crossiella equi]|uniref:Transport permease protein n=1 Tax=Crossiella equi TaxID=130796 RepID=A0ABS5ALF5_9PSEU|nr:ABC transporter permease [Crossiella equi]MBP2477412.1 ABC-2 type transport system permease protein [Crossiella equi]
MSTFTKITATELKLLLREPASWLLVLLMPVVLVAVFGVISSPRTNTSSVVTYFPAMALALGISQLALNLLPTTLANYREHGILRRMATTPVHPGKLLGAQLAVSALMALVSLALVLLVGSLGFGFPLPRQPLGFALAFLLGTSALFAIALVIAAVAPTTRVATGIGVGVFFLSILLGGVSFPAEIMPGFMNTLSGYLPIGASMQALRASWGGEWPETVPLLVLGALTVVCSGIAARMFRWE